MIKDNGDLADYSTLEPKIPDSWVDEQVRAFGGVLSNLIYDGKVKFSFDEQAGHKYVVSKLVDKQKGLWTTPYSPTGVTTITHIINKPALVQWAANVAAGFIKDNLTDIKQLKRLTDMAKRAHIEESNKGKRAGTVGHSLVEAILTDQPIILPSDPEAKKQAESVIKAFKSWQQDYEPELVESEMACYSLEHDFAGKFDYLGHIDGKLMIIDFKTTKASRYAPDGIYADMFCQIGGYALLLEEMLDVVVDDGAIVALPKDGRDYAMRTLSDLGLTITDAKLFFLAALTLYNLNKTFEWKTKG